MSENLRLFTSESVTEGHPDKMCDRISDSILDEILSQDPAARVAVECLATTGLVHVAGEITTSAYVEIPDIVRREICDIGYTSSAVGLDGATCGVSVSVGAQSPDIAAGVDQAEEIRAGVTGDDLDAQGAGDQGIMFGYACNETPDLMPAPIWLSHRLARQLAQVRHEGIIAGLRPDGKTQVTLGYDGDKPVSVDTVVISTQHDADRSRAWLRAAITAEVIDPVLAEAALPLDHSALKIHVNPAGKFVIGGPAGDAGLTGRKIIVDTYGGASRHGGGAFSGKDPSKVDRSGAYAARWAAKHVVAAGLASRCEIQLAYAIGRAHPVGLYVETFGTEQIDVAQIQAAIDATFDFRPRAMINDLNLLRPIYRATTTYGHFGRAEFPWEHLTRVNQLRAAAGN